MRTPRLHSRLAAVRTRAITIYTRLRFVVPLAFLYLFKREGDRHTIILVRAEGGFRDGGYSKPVIAHCLGNTYMVACIAYDIHMATRAEIIDSEAQNRVLSSALEIINGKGGTR